jgi:hypothetical protein
MKNHYCPVEEEEERRNVFKYNILQGFFIVIDLKLILLLQNLNLERHNESRPNNTFSDYGLYTKT